MASETDRARIHVIPADICRKICTGQVVITLSGACKELIDNSLDANAQTVEIKVKKMGLDLLEVSDDGTGIHSTDFDALCKPHATSKLTNFNDFNQLTTFGFRGEALSSLCAVSIVSITTRHTDETVATKLHFDHNGSIVSREKCARSVGTTVSINKLFETLPVRRKEFERTIKKAFTKLLCTVQSFALSRTDVRFIVNSLLDGKQHQALVTPGGNAAIKDVIVNLFGARFEKGTVLDIIQKEPDESICALYGISDHSKFDDIKISGYVSSCVHGQGRSTADRQFVYFNKRPVDYAKLCRIANEIYQQYNRGQYCMLVLFIDVPPETIDVNVSPDKRSVFFEREKELFALLRSSLLATFAPHLGHVDIAAMPKTSDATTGSSSGSADDSSIYITQPNDIDDLFDVSAQSFRLPFEPKSNIGPSADISFAEDESHQPCTDLMDIKELAEMARKRPASKSSCAKSASVRKRPANFFEKFNYEIIPHTPVLDTSNTTSDETTERNSSQIPPIKEGEDDDFRKTSLRTIVEGTSKSDDIGFLHQEDLNFPDLSDDDEIQVTKMDSEVISKSECNEGVENDVVHRIQQTIPFSITELKNRLHELHLITPSEETMKDESGTDTELRTEFRIDNPEIAESELAAYITKKDFESMEIVGQFNKGFIIVHLNNDLFIIDQHASDEKYNFERFQKKARIQTQKLISPRVLDLGVVKEAILRDNIDIFSYNGFEFSFSDEELVGKRALLTAIPVLNSWQFSISDIDEMLSVLCDFPGTMYRPTKLRKIFASRACRKSVMIGSSLTEPQMEKIVRHLGELDHPWNCPHGRPTLRHLCALSAKVSKKIKTT